MRVTTGPRTVTVTVLVLAGIVVSTLLLVVAIVGLPGGGGPDRAIVGTAGTAGARSSDDGYANPWEAGNAAALEELAEQGLATADACP
jgi:hypothetical protein